MPFLVENYTHENLLAATFDNVACLLPVTFVLYSLQRVDKLRYALGLQDYVYFDFFFKLLLWSFTFVPVDNSYDAIVTLQGCRFKMSWENFVIKMLPIAVINR